ncbi:MAG: type I DNA topoisomerase [FCB group bacterium]
MPVKKSDSTESTTKAKSTKGRDPKGLVPKKKLVVVESPAKAKTINKYLGKDYTVEASVGHIKDLETFRLGVDIKNGFQPKYVTVKGKADIIKKIKTASKNSQSVLIATDPDREGEAIAWHLANEIRTENPEIQRVLFNEITKSGIQKGLKEVRAIDENIFMSQQARRVMDRLIGYQVSPFLSRAMLEKTSESLSAGRVQSVALRLICERETEIQTFVPIEYWNLIGKFETSGKKSFSARLVSFDGTNITNPDGSAKSEDDDEQNKIDKKLASLNFIRNEEQAESLKARIEKEKYSITDIIKKTVSRKPFAPFTTSSLQQEASKRLGFSNKKTMTVAQRLYEGVEIDKETIGLITYMRTDSMRISDDAQKAAIEHIEKTFGKEFLPDKPNIFSSKSKNVQDAHEAIRPTILDYTPKQVSKFLDKDHASLYELVYNRFLASQMASALYDQTTVEIQGGVFTFKVTGSVLLFKGFLAVYDDSKEEKNGNGNGNGEDKDSDVILPGELVVNALLDLINLDLNKAQTKPKSRFNTASLVKELDELGIGRPSTYATIVSTLTDRNYVAFDKKSFVPTELGLDVSKILVHNFPDIFTISFTAEMEESLDSVADGDKTYLEILNNFYTPFQKALQFAEQHGDIPAIICEKCGGVMIIKVSRRGRFLGCSNYPDCDNTKPLPKEDKAEKAEPEIAEGITCDICGKPMYIRTSRFGKFYGCVDYPTCKGTKPFTTGVKCPQCHEGVIIERYSPKSKKKFYGCSRYPDCNYINNHELLEQKCASCGHDYLEVRFRKNGESWEKYLACPNCKETFEIKV